MKPLKIIFFGTTDFGQPSLEKLIHSSHSVLAVVCQPDRPNKRGRKIEFLPIKKTALKYDLDILQAECIRDQTTIDRLKAYQPDLFVVAAYGQLLSQEVLNIPTYGALNIHGSLLPKYRGAAPIQRAIIDGEKKTGVTIMQMDAGMDTGAMLAKTEVAIDKQTTLGQLHQELSRLGADLLLNNLEQIIDGQILPIPQIDAEATYANKITKETGYLTWNERGDQIVSRINGCDPIPGAYFFLDQQKFKCFLPVFIPQELNYTPGTIIESNDQNGFFIAVSDGMIKIQEIQAPGKKRMNSKLYLRGNPIESGKILK